MKTARVDIIGCWAGGVGRGGIHSIGYAHACGYQACERIQLAAVSARTLKHLA